jgi:hypothetical protein
VIALFSFQPHTEVHKGDNHMDAIELFLVGLADKAPWLLLVLSGLGSLMVVAQAVVIITPSKKDDELMASLEKHSILGALLNLLKKFAPIAKK